MSVSLTTCEHSVRWRKYPLFSKDTKAAYIKMLGAQDVNVFVSFVAMVVADTSNYSSRKLLLISGWVASNKQAGIDERGFEK
jgi:hypothetical protein